MGRGTKIRGGTRTVRRTRDHRRGALGAAALVLVLTVAPAGGEAPSGVGLYGLPGLVDMPDGRAAPDGTLTLSSNYRNGVLRNTLAFQITPRLSGAFRYSYLERFLSNGASLYDRSFDLRYQLVAQGERWPGIAIGLQDFGGTGIFGSEYIAATHQVTPRLSVTGGIGWGRLGSYDGFANPLGALDRRFEARPGFSGRIEDTGRINVDRFFRGDAALFGGIAWQATARLRLVAEYSSDAYVEESSRMGFDHRSPVNFGAQYRLRHGGDLGVYVLHGSAVTLQYAYQFDPARPRFPSGRETAPPPVVARDSVAAASWGAQQGARPGPAGTAALAAALHDQGLVLESLDLAGDTAVLGIGNGVWNAGAQAIGRAARTASAHLPPEVAVLRIRPMEKGMALAEVVILRADLEELEHAPDGAWQSYLRAGIIEAKGPLAAAPGANPSFQGDVTGYLSPSVFDPDNPLRADLGVQARFEHTLAPGWQLAGALRKRLIGNRDQVTRLSDSVLPHVRSDGGLYDRVADPELSYLTVEHFFRPGPQLYGRLTAGYLERMYGGVSAELLWKPVASRLALGAELNYARQRDHDALFGFRDYDVITGHGSAYYDLGGGYLGQVDMGRYLAGDWGATVALDREFGNGVTVGAFFTLTDVSFDDFGEGSFDKGIRLTVPLSWLTGEASRRGFSTTIRPVLRDGGARLEVRNRLYGLVRGYHQPELAEHWARFWR